MNELNAVAIAREIALKAGFVRSVFSTATLITEDSLRAEGFDLVKCPPPGGKVIPTWFIHFKYNPDDDDEFTVTVDDDSGKGRLLHKL